MYINEHVLLAEIQGYCAILNLRHPNKIHYHSYTLLPFTVD